ncbi:MAG: arsenic resistance N-acetyltransferase ArsN2 [Chryseolinea sp.]
MELTSKVINDAESFAAFRSLLQSANLPTDDLDFKKHLLIGFYDGVNPVATGGLEVYNQFALLRSLSVKFGIRGQSLGSSITEQLIDHAKAKKISAIYLLTETAHAFFLKRGFQDVAREDIPQEIKASSEFSHVCPTSAVCMVYKIN